METDVDAPQLRRIAHVAGAQDIGALAKTAALAPFDPPVVAFLSALSGAILKSPLMRPFPEMVAFAYWIRASQIKKLQADYSSKTTTGVLSARGTVFHIAPANVDTIFLYSLVLSMLAGNKNVVRVSSRDSEQVSLVITLMRALLSDPTHGAIGARLAIIRYDRSADLTGYLSGLCDMRVIWGGDASVRSIRSLPLPVHATELCFPDKVSLAVIDSNAFLALSDVEKGELAGKFLNDSYVFGQMACSSPHLVVWRGDADACGQAASLFWSAVEARLASGKYDVSVIDVMNKLNAEQRLAARHSVRIRAARTNLLRVSTLDSLTDFESEERCGGGFFRQANMVDIDGLTPVISRRVQTIAAFGISGEEWRAWIARTNPAGLDRIVPIGTALDFSVVWDGFDLLREFSREIGIGV